MEIGVVVFPYDIGQVREVGRIADSSPQRLLFGIPDSPLVFADTYVAQEAVLDATENLAVGPFSTNPVTRHWSVHAAMHRSLNEQHPGRSFMALAPGDSAVHSFGLPPARPAEVREHAERVREHGPDDLRLMIAAGGPRAAAAAALGSDEVVFGQGFDPGATEQLTEAALAARREEGAQRPLKRWLYVLADIWADDGSGDPAERESFQSMIMAYSRQAVSGSYAGKNVPEELRGRLQELYSAFSFEDYGGAGNAALLADFAAEKRFLNHRFGVQGSPEEVAEQLQRGVSTCGVDGVWVGLLTENAAAAMRLFAEEVVPRLAAGDRH